MGKLKELLLGSRPQQIDRDAMIEQQINDEYDRCSELHSSWRSGERNPLNESIKESTAFIVPPFEILSSLFF